MLTGLWTNYWEDWELQHRVVFNGVTRTITIGSNTTQIDVKQDLYSAWKEWTLVRDNSKYAPAFRVVGGDPIGDGIFAGDIYFLINDWKIILDHNINFVGVLFSDDYPSPFETLEGIYLSTNRVSNLVLRVGDEPGSSGSVSGGLTTEQEQKIDNLILLNNLQTSSLSQILQTQYDITSSLGSVNLTVTSIDDKASDILLSQSFAYVQLIEQSSSLAQQNYLLLQQSSSLAEQTTQLQLMSGSLTRIEASTDALLSTSGSGLTPQQTTMLLEMYRILGLDPTRPLIVNPTNRFAGTEISQSIVNNNGEVTVTRI